MAKEKEEKEESEKKEQEPEEGIEKKSDKILIYSIIILFVIIASFFVIRFLQQPKTLTIDDLNALNIEGKLDPEQGYMYKGIYSFVKLGGLWYTQLKSPSGRSLYNIPLHFTPRDLEDLTIEGSLDKRFSDAEEVYITFNPLGKDLPHVALAIGEFDQSLITSFGKIPIGACDKNETKGCKDRPIVTCEDEDKAVVYFNESIETKIIFSGNCVIIQGYGSELVRAVDRVLMKWYKIME